MKNVVQMIQKAQLRLRMSQIASKRCSLIDGAFSKNQNLMGLNTFSNKYRYSDSQAARHHQSHREIDDLFTFQNYSFRILTPRDQVDVLSILSKEYDSHEPLSIAYYKKFAEKKGQSMSLWKDFWAMWVHNITNDNLSVGVYDRNNHGQLVGVSCGRDITYEPPYFAETYLHELNWISSYIHIEEQLFKITKPEIQQILHQRHRVLDLWGVAIKKEYVGKKLFHKLMKANEMLALFNGYKHAFCYSSNVKLANSLQELKYNKIAEIDASQVQFKEVKPFELIDESQKKPALWFKAL